MGIRCLHMLRRIPTLPLSLLEEAKASAGDVVAVFCPECEDAEIDSEVLIFFESAITEEAAATGACRCFCSRCGSNFCGICRLPCHPDVSCFADRQHVEG